MSANTLAFDVPVSLPWQHIRDFEHLARVGLKCIEEQHDGEPDHRSAARLAELRAAFYATEEQIRQDVNANITSREQRA